MLAGIQLFNEKGKKYFDTSTQTWNYIGSFIAPANGPGSAVFGELALMTEVIYQRSAVANPPANQAGLVHTVSRNGNVVNASGGTIRTLIVVLGR